MSGTKGIFFFYTKNPLFSFAPAAIIGFVTEPDAAILLKTAHFAVVDGAEVGWLGSCITILGIHGLVGVVLVIALVLRFLLIPLRLESVLAWQITVFEQPIQSNIGSLEQVLAAFSPQGNLADKAGWSDVASVPGSRGLGNDGIILWANVFVHFDFSFD